MKWISYEADGRCGYGLVVDGLVYDAADLGTGAPGSLRAALDDGLETLMPPALPTPSANLDEVSLLPPVPDPGKILCVGMNYGRHRAEMQAEAFAVPTLFSRFADTQIGAGAPALLPDGSDQLDYEGELAVVIGSPLFRAGESEVMAAVAGYACYNDFSVRDWQFQTSQWLPGKNFPGTGAFGPWLVTPDEVGDPADLRLSTLVNGELRQSASTADLIFSIPEILVYISRFTALAPGDVVVTGTPAGVGYKREPPQFLADGDVVQVTIERVGVLRNVVRNGSDAAGPVESAAFLGDH